MKEQIFAMSFVIMCLFGASYYNIVSQTEYSGSTVNTPLMTVNDIKYKEPIIVKNVPKPVIKKEENNIETETEEEENNVEELQENNIEELQEFYVEEEIIPQEESYDESDYSDYNDNNNYNDNLDKGTLTQESGVNYYNDRTETYYSSNVLYHQNTDNWTLDDEGFYRTDEGYYVVAASDMPQGTTFEGSKGTCVVLDSGCAAGTTDYYVNW